MNFILARFWTSMSVLLIVGPKCTLAVSHAVPWWVTVSMSTGHTDRRTNRQTDGRQTVSLRFGREMYAGRVACCPPVNHGKYIDGTYRQTNKQTDRRTPNRFITLFCPVNAPCIVIISPHLKCIRSHYVMSIWQWRLFLFTISPRTKVIKRGVALTGRNLTGPPCSRGAIIRLKPAWRHRLACAVKLLAGPLWSVTNPDRRRRQTPATVTSLAPYTMCRRVSNN